MRLFPLFMTLFFSSFFVHAQDKEAQINDIYKGRIEVSNDEFIDVTLQLKHQLYHDEGGFILNEVFCYRKTETTTGKAAEGSWTVLKGSAADDNATVVELDNKNGRLLYYYLRLKNGNLQQLDTTLHQIKPVSKHILRKQ